MSTASGPTDRNEGISLDPLRVGVAFLLTSHAAAFLATHAFQWSFEGAPRYLQIARNLAEAGAYSLDGSTPTCYRSPAYPAFLAGTILLFGQGLSYAAPVVQCVLSVGTGILTSRLAASLFRSRRAGGIAAVLYGAHVTLVLESFTLRETGLFAAVVVAIGYAIVCMQPGIRRFVILGILFGLAYLTRSTAPPLIVAATVATAYQSSSLHGRASRWMIGIVPCMLAFLCTAAPWMYYTEAHFGRIFPGGNCCYGQTLYAGNNPIISTEVYPWIDWDHWTKYIWRPGSDDPSEYMAREDWYMRQAVSFMRAHPGRTVRMGIARVLAFYSPIPTPLGYGNAVLRERRLELVDYVPRSLRSRLANGLCVLAIYVGIVGYVRRRNDAQPVDVRTFEAFVLILISLLTLLHVIVPAETRYRLPFDPLLMVFAARYFDLVL